MGLFTCDRCGFQGDPSQWDTHKCELRPTRVRSGLGWAEYKIDLGGGCSREITVLESDSSFAGLRVVATVFYGGRVWEVMAPENGPGLDADAFHKSIRDIMGHPHDPSILSGEYRVREVAVRAETTPATTPWKYSGTAEAVGHLQKIDEQLRNAASWKTQCSPGNSVEVQPLTFDGPSVMEMVTMPGMKRVPHPTLPGTHLVADPDSPAPVTVRSDGE